MTPLQEHIKSQHKNSVGFDLDNFGAIMDDFLKANECQMLITLPEGSSRPQIMDNMGGGPVMAFYFLLNAIGPTFHDLLAVLGNKNVDKEMLADAMLELVRADMLEEAQE